MTIGTSEIDKLERAFQERLAESALVLIEGRADEPSVKEKCREYVKVIVEHPDKSLAEQSSEVYPVFEGLRQTGLWLKERCESARKTPSLKPLAILLQLPGDIKFIFSTYYCSYQVPRVCKKISEFSSIIPRLSDAHQTVEASLGDLTLKVERISSTIQKPQARIDEEKKTIVKGFADLHNEIKKLKDNVVDMERKWEQLRYEIGPILDDKAIERVFGNKRT